MASEWEDTKKHIPVLKETVLSYLAVRPDGVYLDGTIGLGGHASAVQRLLSPNGRLIGLDGDKEAVRFCEQTLPPSCHLVHAPYDTFPDHLSSLGIAQVDGMLLDLGVSSLQLDTPERGFAYRSDGPLDMRFDTGNPITAHHILNTSPVEELIRIFREYGEERRSFAIAHTLSKARKLTPVESTAALAEIVRKIADPRQAVKSLSRIFQALRIAVNDELGTLTRFLEKFVDYLKVGGRIVVISYHSLEDRLVKQTFRQLDRGCVCPPSLPECQCGISPTLKLKTRRVVRPTEEEISRNSRARSARLRAAERI